MKHLNNKLEILVEEIQENIEWLYTINNDDTECISIENLESILTRFFETNINLKLNYYGKL